MAPAGGEGGPETEDQRLPGAARIHRSRDITTVLRRGTRKRTPALDIYILSAPSCRSRVGWVVPKLGHRIVERNRLKRRLREIARRRVLSRFRRASCGADVLIRVRRRAYGATYLQLERELTGVVEVVCSES